MYVRNYFFALFGLYFTFAFVPSALASTKVVVGNSPTTAYKVVNTQTFSMPPNASVRTKDITPSVSPVTKVAGNLKQPYSSGLVIEGVKSGSRMHPLIGNFVSTTSGLRNFAVLGLRRLSSAPVTVGMIGLSAFLDNTDISFDTGSPMIIPDDEGGYIPDAPVACQEGNRCYKVFSYVVNWNPSLSGFRSASKPSFCSIAVDYNNRNRVPPTQPYYLRDIELTSGGSYICILATSPTSSALRSPADQYYTLDNTVSGSGDLSPLPITDPVPATDQDILDSLNQYYNPDPSDYSWFASQPDFAPDYVEVNSIPSYTSSPVVTTSYKNGVTSVTESSSTIDFTVSSNGTAKPIISYTETETSSTYEDGLLVDSSDTVVNSPTPEFDDSIPPNFNIPTDCAFMPTVCRFIDWFMSPPDLEELDLSVIRADLPDVEREYEFSGNASCPAPYEIVLPFYERTFEFSWQIFCDFALMINPLFILFCYIGAAYITFRAF